MALPEGALDILLLPENKDELIEVLTYHVVPANAISTGLATGQVPTLQGGDIAVAVDSGAVTVTGSRNDSGSNVVRADIIASNGIVHVIDQILLPPDEETSADEEESGPDEEESGAAERAFCPDGLVDEDLILPTEDQATCKTAQTFANSLMTSDADCPQVQMADLLSGQLRPRRRRGSSRRRRCCSAGGRTVLVLPPGVQFQTEPGQELRYGHPERKRRDRTHLLLPGGQLQGHAQPAHQGGTAGPEAG